MEYDNREIELALNEKGYKLIAGTDEVGRGPLCGPVVAAACIMPPGEFIEGVTDSKKIPFKKRVELAEKIKEKAIAYEITFIDNKKIDEINILEASRLAMTVSLNNLKIKPDYIITDAMKIETDIPYEHIIKGDLKCYTIGCASILAKVARDDYMIELSKKYPEYGFEKNMGYPTKQHLNAIHEYGILDLHRRSYGPVKKEADANNLRKED